MRARFDEVNVLQHAMSDEILGPFDAAERRQLLDLLTRLSEGPIHGGAMHVCLEDEEGSTAVEECGEHGPDTP